VVWGGHGSAGDHCEAAGDGAGAAWSGAAGSDTDILVEIDPEVHLGLWGYAGLKEYARLFEGPADVVNRQGLKAYVRPSVGVDAIYAF
jgi:predicted nucleotidyltransferase